MLVVIKHTLHSLWDTLGVTSKATTVYFCNEKKVNLFILKAYQVLVYKHSQSVIRSFVNKMSSLMTPFDSFLIIFIFQN